MLPYNNQIRQRKIMSDTVITVVLNSETLEKLPGFIAKQYPKIDHDSDPVTRDKTGVKSEKTAKNSGIYLIRFFSC